MVGMQSLFVEANSPGRFHVPVGSEKTENVLVGILVEDDGIVEEVLVVVEVVGDVEVFVTGYGIAVGVILVLTLI